MGKDGNKTKLVMDNLLNDFKKTYLVSAVHTKNFSTTKKINFYDFLQSKVRNDKMPILIPNNHHKLIDDGIKIVEAINATLDMDHKSLIIVGNLNAFYTCSY